MDFIKYPVFISVGIIFILLQYKRILGMHRYDQHMSDIVLSLSGQNMKVFYKISARGLGTTVLP